MKLSFRVLAAVVVVLVAGLGKSWAFLDYNTTVLGRSYIPGLSLNQAAGFNQKIWGDPSAQSPWYGFLRPYVTAGLSPTNYDLKAGVEVFPVSILGMDLKTGSQQRFVKSLFKDCSAYQCQGQIQYQEVSVIGFFGYDKFVGNIRLSRIDYQSTSKASETIYDSVNGVLLAGNKDQGSGLQFAIFNKEFSWGPLSSLGYLYQRNFYEERNQTRQGHYVLAETARFDYESYQNLKWTVGIGSYETSSHVPEVSVVLALSYSPVSAVGWGR